MFADKIKSEIGVRFDEMTREKRITYSEFARFAGMSPSMISQIVSREKPATEHFVNSCIKYFELETDQIEEFRQLAEYSKKRITLFAPSDEIARKIVAFRDQLMKEHQALTKELDDG